MKEYKGECLCGVCRYAVKAQKPKAMFLCHCSRCRKETGTVHAANVFFEEAQLLWETGENNITYFNLEGTKKERAFCQTCGSPLPKQIGPSRVMLPAGTLDEAFELVPTAHIYYASRASWEDDLKDIEFFDALPSR